jgi:hypothetical protein
MTLFALYERWRPWGLEDTIVALIILALLFLLVLFNRGRSILANAAFLGGLLGCMPAALDDSRRYAIKMGYIENGMLLGFLVGVAARIRSRLKEQVDGKEPEKPKSPEIEKNGPLFWISLLGITGISLGLTVCLVLQIYDNQVFLWMGGFFLAGCLIGASSALKGSKLSRLRPYGELLVVLALSAGIGAIIGLKIVGPILIFDVRVPLSTETLYRIAILSCAGFGGLVGLIAWWFGILRKKPSC